jgi:predicted transglutaminase-like cysteine proteinase
MIAEVLSSAAPALLRIRAGELHAVLLVDDGKHRAVLDNRFKAM